MRRAALLLALVAVAAGCGSSSEQAGEGTGTGSAPPPVTTATATTQPAATSLVVYLVRDGKLAAVRHSVPETKAVARAALAELGFDVTSLSIADGTATVELASPPSDVERAQIVFTLTEFPSVRQVAIGGQTLTRTDEDSFAPPIVVVDPQPGATISSPVRVAGNADTFEATFQIELVDSSGAVVAHRTVTASSGSGERGSYDVTVPFQSTATGDGKLVAYEDSAENGQRIHVVETPVVFG